MNGETYFSFGNMIFPSTKNGKLDTHEFLTAGNGFIKIIELLGIIYAPVKFDLQRNIQKLTKQYEKDPNKHGTIHDMIIAEKQAGGNYAIDALLWFKRGLDFTQMAVESAINDSEDGKREEDLSSHGIVAYEATLEKYHGSIVRSTFRALCNKFPSRSKLMLKFSMGVEGREESIIRDLRLVLTSLKNAVETINQLYIENGIDLETQSNNDE